MTIHTKYATYTFVEAYNDCYLATKTHDKLLENNGKGENTMEIGKPYECMMLMTRRISPSVEVARLYLSDRVVTTSPVLSMLVPPTKRPS